MSPRDRTDGPPKLPKRIWVQQVAVSATALETEVRAARRRGLTPEQEAIADGIEQLVQRARDAALRHDPLPGRWGNWWRGTLVEAAYRNVHAARALMVELHTESEVDAEVPGAVARTQATINREDPRSIPELELRLMELPERRARLRRIVEDGYEAVDQQHAQLRSFRNIVLMSACMVTVLVLATAWVVAAHPTVMPFCFPRQVPVQIAGGVGSLDQGLTCPTRARTTTPSGGDVLVVALLGLLGGAVAAAVSVRSSKGTTAAYDVPVALAMLKVPLGALTAMVGLVAIQGDFVPGLTVLDSQTQVLAYALLLGFGQHVFTRLLDRQSQDLLSGLRGQDVAVPPPRAPLPSDPVPAALSRRLPGSTALPQQTGAATAPDALGEQVGAG